MKNALLIHGCCSKEEYFNDEYPSGSNSHWFPWLQKQLLIEGIITQSPEMPNPYKSVYDEWKKEFERFDVNEDTILVGHSCGSGFLLRWLGDSGKKVSKLVMVAPYLDPKKTRGDFLQFKLNPNISDQVKDIHVLNSEDDDEAMQISTKRIMDEISNVELHKFENMGHFTLNDMKTGEFPELRDIVLR